MSNVEGPRIKSFVKDEHLLVKKSKLDLAQTNEVEIHSLEIQRLTMKIFNYFCMDLPNFNPMETIETLAIVEQICQSIKNKILMIQLANYDLDASEKSSLEREPYGQTLSFVDQVRINELFLNDVGNTLNRLSKSTNDVAEEEEEEYVIKRVNNLNRSYQGSENYMTEGLKNIRQTVENLRRTDDQLNLTYDGSDENLIEGIENIKETQSNLRRFQNVVKLDDSIYDEEE